MNIVRTVFKLTPVAALCLGALPASATNGMLMEGYGPVATGMGGAAQAVDHGTAAMAQNPATLALMAPTSRHDAAFGILGPRVASSMPGMGSAESSGKSYVMPAFGYARRSGNLTYGFGLFAQGGMGTEYGADSFLAMGSGQGVRSELGVGSLLFPLAWQVTPALALGLTVDLMWSGLDMRMAASGAQLGGLVTGASGNLAAALPALGGAPWARIDFSNSSDFTGAARSTGWGAKLGLVHKAMPGLVLGASYRMKSSLKDMKTGTDKASLSATGGFTDSGRITVIDFQWPAMSSLGAAWQATPALLVAADIKRIGWADVMKDFRLRYDSAGMGGSVSFALPQQWKDQTVTSVGVAYGLGALTLRGGINHADNPIPDALVNPLFPATVKSHYTLGAGWRFSATGELNASLTIAPTSKVTNGMGVEITHKQTNLQFMYSRQFL
ncbi:MAG TPA: outer membrane protein transport protein [Rubrivivax sp.]|nr:outer membrane protein transport protein [Rubrivivax sp.]